jgi:DNA polymerase-3 subunit beta
MNNLNYVTRALSTKPQMPVLTGIKIDVKNDQIYLTASNTDISIQTSINQSSNLVIEEEGVVVLPGKYLLEMVRKTDAKMIEFFSFEENMVKILAGRSNLTLNVFDKSAFPLISFDDTKTNFTLDVLNLKQFIKKTTFASSTSESRISLTGVSFTANENKLEAISTDSYRLAKKYMLFDQKYTKISAIIPSKSLDELNKIIEDLNEPVEMHFSKTKVLFKYKNVLFQTRLIEGVFPNTSSLIPSEFITSIKFNKHELVAAIERASLFSTIESTNIIKMALTDDRIVEVSSTNNEIGAVLEELYPIECTNYTPFQIAFSSKYFLDAIRAFDSSELTIHFTGEIKPFIITGEHDVNHLQLILPVRGV